MVLSRAPVEMAAALDLVGLRPLMARSTGSSEVAIGLVDGPVVDNHPDLGSARIRNLRPLGSCVVPASTACSHGTFVAGILVARRGSAAPAICPGCTLLVRPLFHEREIGDPTRNPTPRELAEALVDCVRAGARIVNLSLSTGAPSISRERPLNEALDFAAGRGVIVVAAAGNDGMVGTSAITRHPAVIPVVSADRNGWPSRSSNLGGSIGRRGLSAPGEAIESLNSTGSTRIHGGTSSAAAFVTGTVALLWSLATHADASEIRTAVLGVGPRQAVRPPLLNASDAMQRLGK